MTSYGTMTLDFFLIFSLFHTRNEKENLLNEWSKAEKGIKEERTINFDDFLWSCKKILLISSSSDFEKAPLRRFVAVSH